MNTYTVVMEEKRTYQAQIEALDAHTARLTAESGAGTEWVQMDTEHEDIVSITKTKRY